jgi:hypothetical protein
MSARSITDMNKKSRVPVVPTLPVKQIPQSARIRPKEKETKTVNTQSRNKDIINDFGRPESAR